MPVITEETVIPAPPDKVWPLLRDPAVVAACIPGAELAPDTGDGVWRGSISVKFGPTVASFRGEATLDFDDETMTCIIQGRGIDKRGASRALASGKMALTGDETSTLKVDGEFNVTGPLEMFANAGGVHVAKALLAEFSTNLAQRVASEGSAVAEAPADARTTEPAADTPTGTAAAAPQTPPPTAPQPQVQAPAQPGGQLNAFSLMWKIIKSMLAGLIGKKGQ